MKQTLKRFIFNASFSIITLFYLSFLPQSVPIFNDYWYIIISWIVFQEIIFRLSIKKIKTYILIGFLHGFFITQIGQYMNKKVAYFVENKINKLLFSITCAPLMYMIFYSIIYFIKKHRKYYKIYLILFPFLLLGIYKRYTKYSINNTLEYDSRPLTIEHSTKGKRKKVVVIGGGISGLTCAKYLLKSGFEVILLEKDTKIGGNNNSFIDADGNEYPTTVMVCVPSQTVHYTNMCKEYGIEHIEHDNRHNGKFFFKNKIRDLELNFNFFKNFNLVDKIIAWRIIYNLKKICILNQTELSVSECLGEELIKSNVFQKFFMPWVGINTWCDFEELNSQPAYIFGAFIFEYLLAIPKRLKHESDGWYTIDGRLIREIYKDINDNEKSTIKLNAKINSIKKEDNKFIIQYNSDKIFSDKIICDKIVMAVPPDTAASLIKSIENYEEDVLLEELKKWEVMDCYVILHKDFRYNGDAPFFHGTFTTKITKKQYNINIVKPIMNFKDTKYLLTFVYRKEYYYDYLANHIDKSKIVKTYYPRLPKITIKNGINRNEKWKYIDKNNNGILWTHACKSGLQYHNNAILSAKRTVKSLLGENW